MNVKHKRGGPLIKIPSLYIAYPVFFSGVRRPGMKFLRSVADSLILLLSGSSWSFCIIRGRLNTKPIMQKTKMRQKLSSVLTSYVRWWMRYRFDGRPLTHLPFSQFAPTLSIADSVAILDTNYWDQEIPKYCVEPQTIISRRYIISKWKCMEICYYCTIIGW